MHISEGGIDLDLASHYNKKIAFLDKADNKKRIEPYWTNDYTYINELEEVSLNKIKPEKIARSILKHLNIDLTLMLFWSQMLWILTWIMVSLQKKMKFF